jgi:hypothetical protein
MPDGVVKWILLRALLGSGLISDADFSVLRFAKLEDLPLHGGIQRFLRIRQIAIMTGVAVGWAALLMVFPYFVSAAVLAR